MKRSVVKPQWPVCELQSRGVLAATRSKDLDALSLVSEQVLFGAETLFCHS